MHFVASEPTVNVMWKWWRNLSFHFICRYQWWLLVTNATWRRGLFPNKKDKHLLMNLVLVFWKYQWVYSLWCSFFSLFVKSKHFVFVCVCSCVLYRPKIICVWRKLSKHWYKKCCWRVQRLECKTWMQLQQECSEEEKQIRKCNFWVYNMWQQLSH